jgi:hypothetical protein
MSTSKGSRAVLAALLATSIVSGPLVTRADEDPTKLINKPVAEMNKDEIIEQSYELSRYSREEITQAFMQSSAKLSENTSLSPSDRVRLIDEAYKDISETINQIQRWKYAGTTGTFMVLSLTTVTIASLAGPAMLKLNAAGVGLLEKAVPNQVGGAGPMTVKLPLVGQRINGFLTTAANGSKEGMNFALKWTNWGITAGQRILQTLGRQLLRVTLIGASAGGASTLVLYYFEWSAIDELVPKLQQALTDLEKMKAAEAYINGSQR